MVICMVIAYCSRAISCSYNMAHKKFAFPYAYIFPDRMVFLNWQGSGMILEPKFFAQLLSQSVGS